MDNVSTVTKNASRKGYWKIISRFLRGSIIFFCGSLISAAVVALADMILPQIVCVTVDQIVPGTTDGLTGIKALCVSLLGGISYLADRLWLVALIMLAVAFIKMIFQYLYRVFTTEFSETLVKTMRDDLFTHIQHLPYAWLKTNQTGDIIQRCTSDVEMIRNFISENLPSLFRIAILLLFSLFAMFSMNTALALVAIIPMPFVILYSVFFHKKMREGFKKCDENEGKLSAMVQENLTGIRVVRAFGKERRELDRFKAHNEYYTGLWIDMGKVMSRFWSTSDILTAIQVMLVVIFGAVFCIRHTLTTGEYLAFISYNALLSWPIRQLGRTIAEMSKMGVSMDRIAYIVNAEEEQDPACPETPDMHGDICFKDVSFSFDGTEGILSHIDLTIPSGTTLGILGGTGSGKSTLMLLLDKMHQLPEDQGKITVGGVDIRNISSSYLRSNIGFVLQEPFLFSSTIAENIGITRRGKLDMNAVRRASRTACFDDAVLQFSKGYDTFVGERGVTLSGGQKQRAAIARTLMQDAPIMIFDDSLSAVDTETDARIRASLEQKFGTATIIIISHRISTLSKSDHIIVLDKGKIIEEGTHEELKAKNGVYAEIDRIQSYNADTESEAIQ